MYSWIEQSASSQIMEIGIKTSLRQFNMNMNGTKTKKKGSVAPSLTDKFILFFSFSFQLLVWMRRLWEPAVEPRARVYSQSHGGLRSA